MRRTSKHELALVVVLLGAPAVAADPGCEGPCGFRSFFHRLAPVGGCDPDGRGMFHWWDRECFVYPCAPNDYCRKPLPRLHCPPRPIQFEQAPHHHRTHDCATCAGHH
jgi:hypothetical protein